MSLPCMARALILTSGAEWGGHTRMVRNGQGLPVREEREAGPSRRYAFDPNANVRWVIDFDGHRTDYAYASDNHLAARRDELGRVWQFEHSAYEKLTAFVDAGGTRSEYGYDRKDRLIEVRRHGRVRERYVYDAIDNLMAIAQRQVAPMRLQRPSPRPSKSLAPPTLQACLRRRA